MSEKLDNQGGSVADESLKSTAAPGLGADIVNPEGVLIKNKELLAEKKQLQDRLDRLEQAEKQRQEEEAKKRGDFETLLKDREEKLRAAAQENKQLKIASRAIAEYELVDPDAVILFMGQVSDDMGNLGEVMAELKDKKPWLFRMPHPLTPVNPPAVPTDKSKGSTPNAPGHVFTRAEINAMSTEQYSANKSAILDQLRRGVIK
ncbi:MAG TPA: hypothetical protein VLH56_11310 [Dissulfurispiraceae bacterium]|nr:hypothetical protein [Dissulfurispiraceae bacterium]